MSRFHLGHALSLTAAAVVCVTVAGCGSKVSNDNLNKVNTGMSEQEVEAILGAPTKTDSAGALGMTGSTKTWQDGNKQIVVTFVNGKVATKTGSGL